MTLEEAKMFVLNYEHYIRIFGEKILQKCLAAFTIEQFSSSEYVEKDSCQDTYYANKGYPVLCACTWHAFEEWCGEWMRKVDKKATEYRVPSHTQTREGELLRLCLVSVKRLLCL